MITLLNFENLSLPSSGPRVASTTKPDTSKPEFVSEVTPGDLMKAAHAFRKEHKSSMSEALQWAYFCKAQWERRVAEVEQAKRDEAFKNFKRRRHVGKIVDAVEVIGYRPGIERVSLNRAEKKADNELRLAKGLEPKYLTL